MSVRQCPGCERTFSSQNGLYYHMNKEHPELVKRLGPRSKGVRRFITLKHTVPVQIVGTADDGFLIVKIKAEEVKE